MAGLFAELGIEQMTVAETAMREGILYDLLGRFHKQDMREATVDEFMRRYHIDTQQAERVRRVALKLDAAVGGSDANDQRYLDWAARLHEIGLVIAHSQHQLHGAYVLAHSDIAGFSQQEQRFLAALVRAHRRRVPRGVFDALPARLHDAARRGTLLLRLAVLLHRAHELDPIPRLDARAEGDRLLLSLSQAWLAARPLLAADLAGEPADIERLGIALQLESA